MACSAMRNPLLKNPTIRHYAAAAAAQCAPCGASNADVKVLGNKITVAAFDNASPLTQVSIIFKAGPRNETYETQGISHLLRICAGLTTNRSSTFAVTRNIQQLGGELTAIGDRESISYTLKITRDNLATALNFLEDVATRQVFKPWEVSDETPRFRHEVSNVPETVRLVELIYKAAYREGLGYSLFSPKRQIGKINSETLSHFVANHYTGPRCAVVGSGICLNEIESFATGLSISSQEGCNPISKYMGGEIRKERNSELASVALAVEGTGLKNAKDAITFAVLQKAVGDGPKVKWGSCNTPLYKALCSTKQDLFAAVSFNASHSDTGLFGIIISAPADSASALVKAGADFLKSPNISDCDVARGKAALKVSVLSVGDNPALLHESIGQQALFFGSVLSPGAIAAEIDKITTADVQKAACQVANGKLSMASIGNLSNVPYLQQL
ncbi:cytochrome b-c1 complex subunit 2, mitochondrial [Copidosoma floridanum]|uniref:cytochrome b-c1 complex subunit 2, mitochondrial n=1 Tax=Copidosoma floridanum TaxID=29053 RepID=UPI0006C98667|nr:cytochrome b-c1 complex subunit 2, mitochondrial [Copidosoma floridanum]